MFFCTSIHLTVFWVLFENVMTLHLIKVVARGLLVFDELKHGLIISLLCVLIHAIHL